MPARNYSSTAAEISLFSPVSAAATTLVLDGTAGLPDVPFTLVLDPGAAGEEIVSVTELDGTTATVVRGVDGTIGVTHNLGAEVRHMLTARDLQEPQDHIYASTDVHGAVGAVVGTTGTQVLTNKTMSGADNTFEDIPDSAIVEISAAKIVGDLDATSVGGIKIFVQPSAPTAEGVGDIWVPTD